MNGDLFEYIFIYPSYREVLPPPVAVGLNLKSIFMLKKGNFVFAILPAASTYFVRAHTANPT